MNPWKLQVVDKYGDVWDVPVSLGRTAETLKHLVDAGMPKENIRLVEAEPEIRVGDYVRNMRGQICQVLQVTRHPNNNRPWLFTEIRDGRWPAVSYSDFASGFTKLDIAPPEEAVYTMDDRVGELELQVKDLQNHVRDHGFRLDAVAKALKTAHEIFRGVLR